MKSRKEVLTFLYNEQLEAMLRQEVDVELMNYLVKDSPADKSLLLQKGQTDEMYAKKKKVVEILARKLADLKKDLN